MKYKSKPAEIEAEQWAVDATVESGHERAHQIIAWVNANGGEAKYEPEHRDKRLHDPIPARIAVRTINGWAYAAPGHFVVMGSVVFRPGPGLPGVRDFYPCDPETFEKRWEQI